MKTMLKHVLGRSNAAAAELAEEMSLHIQEKAEALEEAGYSPQEALAAARKAFGNQALLQDRSVAVWANRFASPFFDLKAAVLQLKRFPSLTLTGICIIAIGIGANTAVFNALYSATKKSLPIKDSKNLVFLQLMGPRLKPSGGNQLNPAGVNLTPRLFTKLRAQQTVFTDVAGITNERATIEDGGTEILSLPVSFVSDNFFDVLDVTPAIGRTYIQGAAEDRKGTAPSPIILDYRFWKEHFQGSPSVIGRQIRVANFQGVITGVAPETFSGLTPEVPPKLYLPIGLIFDSNGNGIAPPLVGGAPPIVRAVGRLKPGVDVAQANASLLAFNAHEVKQELRPFLHAQPYFKDARVEVEPASHGVGVLDQYRNILLLLQSLLGAALLLCCLNVIALQLALTYERSHEFALRVALGANRNHLMRQCLYEGFLLAGSGAVFAIPILVLIARLLPRYLTHAGAADTPTLFTDWTTFGVAGALVIVVAVLVGMIPALLAGRIQPNAVLKARSALGRPPFLLGRVLVIAQLALAFVLTSAATFFVTSDRDLQAEHLGFHPEHVVEVTAQFQWMNASNAELMSLYRKMLHRLVAEKGIDAATLTWFTPLSGDAYEMEVHGDSSAQAAHTVAFNQIGPGYFSTLQTSVVEGREFSEADIDESRCIVNRLAAGALFPAGGSLGHNVVGNDEEFPIRCTIVGVVDDAKYSDVHRAAMPMLYIPMTAMTLSRNSYRSNMVFLIRGKTDQNIANAYRETLKDLAPTTSYMRFLPMREQLEQATGRDQLLSLAGTLFALIALLLCGASLLSLMGIRVKQNATDIAVRVALGASPAHVARLVLRESLTLFIVGTALGIAGLGCVAWLLPLALKPTHAVTVFSVACAACTLAGISICAGGLPAIQAARIHPMSLLSRDS